ncbi:MAG: hypothetical protein ACRD0V_18185 [Acidimicrobiales bacterium]
MLRATLVVLASAALLLAGCGDDDNGGSTANDQETADEAIAAVEQSLRDDGFSATADEDDDDLTFESTECREFDEAFPGDGQDLPGETASAESAEFERSDLAPAGGVQETVRAFAGFVEESDDLDPVLELVNDERFGPCLEEAFRIGAEAAAAEDQATVAVGDVEIDQLGSEGLGDIGGGVQLTGEVTSSGFTVPFSVAFQLVRADRALVAIVTTAVGPDEPTADRAALVQILVDSVSDQST